MIGANHLLGFPAISEALSNPPRPHNPNSACYHALSVVNSRPTCWRLNPPLRRTAFCPTPPLLFGVQKTYLIANCMILGLTS